MWNSVSTNKLMETRLKFIEHQRHRNNLYLVKTVLDNKSPYCPPFLKSRSKQHLVKQERDTQIGKQNQILLDKMILIEKKPAKLNKQALFQEYRTDHIAPEAVQRFQFQRKIKQENKFLLQRVSTIASNYSRKQWENHKQKDIYMQQNLSMNARRGLCVDYTNAASFSRSQSNFYDPRLSSSQGLRTSTGLLETKTSMDMSQTQLQEQHQTQQKQQHQKQRILNKSSGSFKQIRPMTSSAQKDYSNSPYLDKMHYL